MPFVDVKTSVAVSDSKLEALKAGIADAIGVFGKGESWLMVGIDDEYALWLGGKRLEQGAYVQVSLVGDTPDRGCKQFSERICDLLASELGIPGANVYVTFHPMSGSRWGWNGGTF